jgi:glycosyltransferase involved in cell wall biosynthesis
MSDTISVIIPFYDCDDGKRAILDRCIQSIKGHYDELVIVAQPKGAGIGFVRAVNMGYALAHGDYIIMCSDDIILKKGSLRQLCDPESVVSAQVEGQHIQDFWGTVWCTPRWVYEKTGPIDEEYAKGIFYEDNDYYYTVKDIAKPYTNIRVVIEHPHGGETLEHTPERDARIEINKTYFFNKWGHYGAIWTTNTAARYGLRLPERY